MAQRDVTNEPMTHLEVYTLVDSICRQVNAYNAELLKNINTALAAVMESKQVDQLVMPHSVKRVKHDAAGNIEYIEEFRPLAG